MQLAPWVNSTGTNPTALFYYSDACFSTIFQAGWSIFSSPVTVEVEASGGGQELSWKHEGFQREFAGQTWGQKNEWSQMSSCDLIRFSITVSFNHSKRREVMKEWWMVGVMKRWRDLGKKGLGVVARLGLCVKCNEPSERASGCFPHFKVISHQILLTRLVGEKHTNTHGLCGIHVHYSNQHKLWLQSGFSGSFNNGCYPLKNNNIKTQIKINCITYCFCVLFQLVLPNSSVWYAPQILLLFLWRDEWHEEKEKNTADIDGYERFRGKYSLPTLPMCVCKSISFFNRTEPRAWETATSA